MRHHTYTGLLLTFCLISILSLSSESFAMSSANYSGEGGFSSGGGSRSSATYAIAPDVIGSMSGAQAASASYTLSSGLLMSVADVTAPGASASVAGGVYNTAQSVTLSCNDFGGSGCFAIYYTTDGLAPTSASSVYSTPLSISTDMTLKFFAMDNDGNAGATSTETYTFIDQTPPVGTVSIDGGAAFTNTLSVTLTLACGDESGCVEVRMSNDNTTWSTPVTYAAEALWILAASEGPRTVYVQFKDGSGNWSASETDGITLAPYRITVSVTDKAGRAVAHAPIQLKSANNTITRWVSSDSNGAAVIEYLTSGEYKAGARLVGYAFTPALVSVSGADASVTVSSARSLWDGVVDTAAPALPTGLSVLAVSSDEVQITWEIPADNVSVSGFRVFNASAQEVGVAVTNRFMVKGLQSATEYCFSVSAFDGAGNESAATAQGCATTQ